MDQKGKDRQQQKQAGGLVIESPRSSGAPEEVSQWSRGHNET